MSLWHGRAPKWIATAALALAVLAVPGSSAFARSGYRGGYHHGGVYRGGYGYHRGYRAAPGFNFGGFRYGYRAPYYGYGSRYPYLSNRYSAYPGYGSWAPRYAFPYARYRGGYGGWFRR